jgi:hypothetical protein
LKGDLKKARDMATKALTLLPSNRANQTLVENLQAESRPEQQPKRS